MTLTTKLRATNAVGVEIYNDEININRLTSTEIWKTCVDVANAHAHDAWTHVEMVYDA